MAHTTISVNKEVYKKVALKSDEDHLSISAVANMLLNAYADGIIKIMPVIQQPSACKHPETDNKKPYKKPDIRLV